MYIHTSIPYTKVETKETKRKEILTIAITLKEKEQLIISNIYGSPNSTASDNDKINNYFKDLDGRKYEQHLILGDFNRKMINWETVSSNS